MSGINRRHPKLAIDSLAYINAQSAATAMGEVANRVSGNLKTRAKWYLDHHRTFQWSDYDVPKPIKQATFDRMATLRAQAEDGFDLVAYLNAGHDAAQSKGRANLTVRRGEAYRWTKSLDAAIDAKASQAATVAYDDEAVVVKATGLDANKQYRLGFTWWDYDHQQRVQSVEARGAGKTRTLVSATPLPAYRAKRQPPTEKTVTIPRALTSEGEIEIRFVKKGESNAVVSEVWLFEATGESTAQASQPTDEKSVSSEAKGDRADPAKIARMKGDVARGQNLFFGRATCFTCHRVKDRGQRFGPNLTGLGKSKQAVLEATIHPSAGLAQGFETAEVIKKDGSQVAGFLLAQGDPVVIKQIGGNRTTIARDQVKTIRRSERSLMPSAKQLGLSKQDLADLAAFLTSDKAAE